MPPAEIVQGSFEDDASLARAMEGVEARLLAGRDGPDAVSQHRRVLEHARRGVVSHIVKLSAVGASASWQPRWARASTRSSTPAT
jgi:uncharacterized protein YbjT (DUF2867 family)